MGAYRSVPGGTRERRTQPSSRQGQCGRPDNVCRVRQFSKIRPSQSALASPHRHRVRYPCNVSPI